MKKHSVSNQFRLVRDIQAVHTKIVTIFSVISLSLAIPAALISAQSLMVAPNFKTAVSFEAEKIVSGTPRQREWLTSTLVERIGLAEKIGDEGCLKYAIDNGYKILLSPTTKTTLHGPDGVFYDTDGVLTVIEGKGGGSPINRGYGYIQGTPEWAVESSKRMLKNPGLLEVERSAYKAVLENAARGNLRVVTVRTRHILGEPNYPVLEKTMGGTSKSVELAKAAMKELEIYDPAVVEAQKIITKASLSDEARLITNSSEVKLGLITKGFAGLAVAGGVVQIYQGVIEFASDKHIEGGADMTGGTANVTAGCALFTGRVALGMGAGGAAAIIDGGKDIYLGVRDDDTKRLTVGSIKAGAGVAMMAGAATCQPEVVVPAAVVYGGAVIYENWDDVCEFAGRGYDFTASAAKATPALFGSKYKRVKSSVLNLVHL